MKHLFAAALVIAATTTTTARAATFQFFTDEAAFDSFFSTTTSFDLSSDDSGLTLSGDDISISNGLVTDRIDQDDAPDTVLSFDAPLIGFGATFDLSPVGAGSGISISVTIGDELIELDQELPSTFTEGFFGFASDTAFTEVSFSEGSRASRPAESYTFAGPVGAIAEIAPVPLPAGFPLMAAALGAFAVLRRRKKTV
ncbi:VPLPA-CTERM sorting domain-containing protein [Epibacterium ulvae]|uniref:VPLPA-CTERM sorting domain-containing protein n=1 Tax=Epibacterium ulvae TaxID=1156985 RepID=UPI001BFCB597|nr:VPLPA-CTERM sorting domain-containing protein [Epibacterium ulvae]MBT8153652.1 VPLPA-CTERM sorting domain-containing protein [Epibacterium ulvae]